MFPIDDSSRNFPFISSVWNWERCPTNQHLVHDYSQRPPVTGIAISLVGEYLRCYVIRGSHCAISSFSSGRLPFFCCSLRVARRGRNKMMGLNGTEIFVEIGSMRFSMSWKQWDQPNPLNEDAKLNYTFRLELKSTIASYILETNLDASEVKWNTI